MKKIIVISSILILIVACSPISVSTDYDTQADFSSLKSFNWLEGTVMSKKDALKPDGLVAKRVKEATISELERKGYVFVKTESPDFFVIVHTGVEDRIDITRWGYTYARRWGPFGRRTTVSKYREGTLFIDIINARTKELIWRGSGTSPMNVAKTPEERDQFINDVVEKILENFPPEN